MSLTGRSVKTVQIHCQSLFIKEPTSKAGAELSHLTEPGKDIQVAGEDSDLKQGSLHETGFTSS